MKKIVLLAALAATMCGCTSQQPKKNVLETKLEEIKEEYLTKVEEINIANGWDIPALCYGDTYIFANKHQLDYCWYEKVNEEMHYSTYYTELHWNDVVEVYWTVEGIISANSTIVIA